MWPGRWLRHKRGRARRLSNQSGVSFTIVARQFVVRTYRRGRRAIKEHPDPLASTTVRFVLKVLARVRSPGCSIRCTSNVQGAILYLKHETYLRSGSFGIRLVERISPD